MFRAELHLVRGSSSFSGAGEHNLTDRLVVTLPLPEWRGSDPVELRQQLVIVVLTVNTHMVSAKRQCSRQ